MPKRLRLGELTLSIGYRPILEDGKVSRVLVVLTDVTAALRSERLELQQRETVGMFERVMRDRTGFLEAFVRHFDFLEGQWETLALGRV